MPGEVNHQGTDPLSGARKVYSSNKNGFETFYTQHIGLLGIFTSYSVSFQRENNLVSFEAKNRFRILVKLYCRHCNCKFLVPDIFKMAVFDARKFCQNLLRVHRAIFGEPIRND